MGTIDLYGAIKTNIKGNSDKCRPVADPGFPVGGAPTPEAATFRKICMSKRKNLDPWGARASGDPPGSATADAQCKWTL